MRTPLAFQSVFCASGARNFFGTSYRHQIGPWTPKWQGTAFVAKTTTLLPRQGNMPLKEDGVTPKELLPRCILPNFRPGYMKLSLRMFQQGIMLNAVGLSGPGAESLFEQGIWQNWPEPFMLSFMAVEDTPEKRLEEIDAFLSLLGNRLIFFKSQVGLQINYSCPNIGLNLDELVDEVCGGITLAHRLRIPLMVKFNVLTPIDAVAAICHQCNHQLNGICVSNTIHWDDLPRAGIDRKKLFGTDISPLAEFGGGGLSGRPLLPLVIAWIRKARDAHIKHHICAGGGIMSPDDLFPLRSAGASSVFLGSVATLRAPRVKQIIRRAHKVFG